MARLAPLRARAILRPTRQARPMRNHETKLDALPINSHASRPLRITRCSAMRAAVTAFAFGINVGKTKRGERDRRGLVFFGVKFVIPRHDLSSRRDAEAVHPNRQ